MALLDSKELLACAVVDKSSDFYDREAWYSLHLWDPQSDQSVMRIVYKTNNRVAGLAVSPEGDYLTVRDSSGTIVWDVAKGTEASRFGVFEELGSRSYQVNCRPIAFSPDGKWLFNEHELRRVSTWEVGPKLKYTGTLEFPSKETVYPHWPWNCSACSFTRDGKHIVISTGGRLAVVEVESGTMIAELTQFEFHGGIRDLAISPDGKMIVSGGDHARRGTRLERLAIGQINFANSVSGSFRNVRQKRNDVGPTERVDSYGHFEFQLRTPNDT